MAIKLQMDGDIAVVTPKGSLIGGNETADLEKAFRGLIDQGNLKLVVDLGGVDMLTSRPIGVLVATHTNYISRGGRVHLCNVDRKINSVFVITKLAGIFHIYNTIEGAMGSF